MQEPSQESSYDSDDEDTLRKVLEPTEQRCKHAYGNV